MPARPDRVSLTLAVIAIINDEMWRETEGITEPIDSRFRIIIAHRRYNGRNCVFGCFGNFLAFETLRHRAGPSGVRIVLHRSRNEARWLLLKLWS